MAVLTVQQDAAAKWREVGRLISSGLAWLLFTLGWLLAKALRGIATALAAALFGIGWLASAAVWPALLWCGRAVKLGWQEGHAGAGRGQPR